MPEQKPKKSKREIWFKFGRFITGVTIACFFLPFFGVSCEGMEFVHFSGADMVGGCKPGGMAVEAEEQKQEKGMGGGDMGGDIKVENVDREPLAIVALGLALLVAGLSWVRSRGAMIGALALSLACIGALAGLYMKVGGDLDKKISAELSSKNAGSQMMKETKVDAGSRFGLWLTVGGLLGVAVLTGMALKEKDGAAFTPSTPPPA
ncbi:MAG TPA: hypothetical protein VFV99_23205 [Kofleriaceae bacterium]|nr:hypothetical protein [Kofleriaceae bacterium]